MATLGFVVICSSASKVPQGGCDVPSSSRGLNIGSAPSCSKRSAHKRGTISFFRSCFKWGDDSVWPASGFVVSGKVAWLKGNGVSSSSVQSVGLPVLADATSIGGGVGKPHADNVIFSVGVIAVARADKASANRMGNSLPRFLALRKIPAAAFGLKKYLCGTWLSKTSNNEHATATLGDSEKLAVKHAPANPIPALDHENAQDFRKVSSTV